jgi:iron complex outermembrane receptor protein
MAKMNKRILAALCGGLLAGARAETTNTVTDAERIVVTATRSPESIRTVPGNPTVITAQDLAAGHYTSVPDALAKKAGIFFKNYTDNPSQASIDMRGFGENSHGRVLVLVDGRRLNEADMASLNWSSIPLTAVERIEVLNGPASVLYGDNAVGGVINIITAKGADKPTFSLSASAGSHDAFTQDATVSGRIDGLGYTAAASHQSGDGYRDRSRYDNTSMYAGLNFIPNEYVTGNAAFSAVDRQYQLPGALDAAQTAADRRQSDELSDVKDTQYNSQLGGIFTPDDKNTFAVDFGYRRLDQIANLNYEGPFGTFYDATKDTWTVEPRYILTLPVGNAVNETTIGLDWRSETILIDRFVSKARSVQTSDVKVDQETLDLYLNDRLFLLDDKLILNAGARTGQSRLKAKDSAFGTLLYDETKDRHENAYTFGLTALPMNNVKLYTKYDEFYRFPFTDEQALYYGFAGFDAVTDLEPEQGRNIEAGGSFAPTEASEISLTVYRMEMENEIRFNPTGGPFGFGANENLPDTLHQGINLATHYQPIDLLRFGLLYNYTEAEFNAGPDNGEQIPWVPRDQFRATVDVMPMDGLTLTVGATYTGKMYAINDNGNNGISQGGYTLFDLMMTYESVCKGIAWNIFAGIDNLFEKEYDLWQVSNGDGSIINHYPAPERTYKAGLGVTF